MAEDKIAIYPGTFDPITDGHLDIIQRGLKIFDNIIIAVAENPKKTLFSSKQRVDMIKESTKDLNLQVESFGNLLADYAKQKNCKIIIRGLRAISDFEHEFQLASINAKLNPDLETIFVMTSEKHSFLSSSAVKEVASLKGDVSSLVPKTVEEKLREKFS